MNPQQINILRVGRAAGRDRRCSPSAPATVVQIAIISEERRTIPPVSMLN